MPTAELIASVEVVQYDDKTHKHAWDEFVRRSMNGTVFHEQQFLSYHAPGKFNFHHLLFIEKGNIVAVLPGGFSKGGKVYESPLGSSYGSFVVEDISADTALAIVRAFEEYIAKFNVDEVYLTSAPVIYQPVITQNLEFALLYSGYAYQRHYISHAVELSDGIPPFERFQSTTRKDIRRVLRQFPDIHVEVVPMNEMERGLKECYPILLKNKAKFKATPTHTLDELLKLNELLPGLLKLFLARKGNEPVAGSLIFVANTRVTLIFYHMLLYEYEEMRPIYLLMNEITRWSQANGYRFVDIGVSQDTDDENPMTPKLSLIRFKEKFDSRGLLRSTLWKRYSK